MQTEIRHVGVVVKDIKEAERIYKILGFKVVGRSKLLVTKMEDSKGNLLELVQGKWHPHLAITFYQDPSGNYMEVVKKC